jgi:hypothetical protein
MGHRRGSFVLAVAVGVLGSALASGASAAKGEATHKDFDPRNFSQDSSTVDNRWIPLVPGTQWVLEGKVTGPDGDAPHRVVLTVTDLTKVVNGVRTIVAWDRDFSNGELAEEELFFHAQDSDGNVWNLGEYPEEYEDGKFAGAPSTWISGVHGAEAGIMMRAEPREGTSAYLQGFAPEIEFEDKAKVLKENERTCAAVDCYTDVLLVDEWNPLEQPQDGHQLKYHAPGVGVVRIKAVGGEEQENMVLVSVRQLGPKAMAEARDRALELDRRAYHQAGDVYGHTPRAERIP